MPPGRPAARARGATRGRGRGGRGASQASAAGGEAIADTVEPQAAQDVAMTDAPIVAASSDQNEQSESVPAAAAPKPRAQRLDSVKTLSTLPPARTASPSTAGASSSSVGAARGQTKRPITRQPVFKGRRTKEERDALIKQSYEMDKERLAESEALQKRREREARNRARGRGRGGRGRGDYGGSMVISGPFSESIISKEHGRHTQRGRSSFVPSGGREMRVKSEGVKNEDGSWSSLGIKREEVDGGYISSEAEDNIEGERFNVDDPVAIDLTEEVDEPGPATSSRAASVSEPSYSTLPIRISRREHVERVFGINTEESGGPKVKTEGNAASKKDVKGKGKAGDLVVIKESKSFQGVWQDDAIDGKVRIKDEPKDDDEPLVIDSRDGTNTPDDRESNQPEEIPKAKEKKRRRSSLATNKPALQTEEERQEWERLEQDLEILRQELGDIEIPTIASNTATTTNTPDQDGDTSMKDQPQIRPDKKADRVYLFQLPPTVPDLIPVPEKPIKRGSTSPTLTRATLQPSASIEESNQQKATQPEAKIKQEEGAAAPETSKNPDLANTKFAAPPWHPRLATGRAGKLRIHKSGKATLDWGGVNLELSMGMTPHFLQDAAVMRLYTPEEKEHEMGFAGEVTSLGLVRGKFVVTPDWDEILGPGPR